MLNPKWQTPQEVIAENIAWLRTLAREALDYDLVTLNRNLNAIADAIAESVAEGYVTKA